MTNKKENILKFFPKQTQENTSTHPTTTSHLDTFKKLCDEAIPAQKTTNISFSKSVLDTLQRIEKLLKKTTFHFRTSS